MEDLRAGHKKRCEECKEQHLYRKSKEDQKAIKNLPSVEEMQEAVKMAYMTLQIIAKDWAEADALPKLARGAANNIMAGAIALDTFSGRKMEWELLQYDYLLGQLQAVHDFSVCSKTLKLESCLSFKA